jgi:predicted glycosyltransferase involved in capsule biosynthesis
MGRLHHLCETLPKNIEDNIYPNVEFVILNYNSPDNLDEWMKQYVQLMDDGKILYLKESTIRFYSMTHSRNVAFKAATGDIVCNVDADNFTGNFATELNRLANEMGTKTLFSKGKRLLHGRLGFFKSDFINMGGYDEDIIGYGHDDRDMFDRAMALGFKIGRFEGNVYINRLHHARADRVKYMLEKNRRAMEERNRAISMKKLKDGMLVANVDKNWGSATLLKNFRETITQ